MCCLKTESVSTHQLYILTDKTVVKRVCIEMNELEAHQNDCLDRPIVRDPATEVVNQSNRETVLKLGPIQPKINFPSRLFGSRLLRFQESWYARYDWLEYSTSCDSAGCFYCRCYGSSGTVCIYCIIGKNGKALEPLLL